ncbi:MAG: Crp/Fnr family transcriptional regulator [Cytophagaceae bacterium]
MINKKENVNCKACNCICNSSFKHLEAEELENLSNDKTCFNYKKGQIIIFPDTMPLGVYCLQTGVLKSYIGNREKNQIIRIYRKGDLIGLTAIINESPYNYTVDVVEDATICFIPRNTIIKIKENNLKFCNELLSKNCKQMHDLKSKLYSISTESVKQRLAATLIELNNHFGTNDRESLIDIALKREELACLVGTSKETVIRILSEYKDCGILSFEKKKIRIINLERLLSDMEQ